MAHYQIRSGNLLVPCELCIGAVCFCSELLLHPDDDVVRRPTSQKNFAPRVPMKCPVSKPHTASESYLQRRICLYANAGAIETPMQTGRILKFQLARRLLICA